MFRSQDFWYDFEFWCLGSVEMEGCVGIAGTVAAFRQADQDSECSQESWNGQKIALSFVIMD